ncbi:MAG: hypothetical protein JWP81_2998 [Ferruginibacter sp.]|nr:hypothetical protein [Ferruginibacter sp.]
MKKQSNILFSRLSSGSLANLTAEVKESLASGMDLPRQKTFSVADLWNIQRRKKGIALRSFSF